jgi:basic membrane lipoprotein Med (substrate-binding protein (PBP1-ABC) superfamily)
MQTQRDVLVLWLIVLCGVLGAPGVFPGGAPATAAEPSGHLQVFGAFATPVEEPWNGVIHAALLAAQQHGHITYTWKDRIGYSGAMEPTLREVASQHRPHLIVGDTSGNEDAVRRVAKDYPTIAFAVSTGLGPAAPNVSVFDSWLHEPAYLCGLIAGTVTTSNTIGVVGGYAIPSVNSMVHACIAGVREANAQAHVSVRFINSWFDVEAAKRAALAQIDAGADMRYAERAGGIAAAKERGKLAFGNIIDQRAQAPQTVISAPVWDMTPTVQYVIQQVQSGAYTAQDLREYSMMAKGGARLAPLYDFAARLPKDLVELERVACHCTE